MKGLNLTQLLACQPICQAVQVRSSFERVIKKGFAILTFKNLQPLTIPLICIGYLAHLFDTKVIQVSTTGPWWMHMEATGNAYSLFQFPAIFNSKWTEPMSFMQRIANLLAEAFMDLYALRSHRLELPHMQAKFPNLPNSYSDYFLERSVLELVNSNPATHGPWPKYGNSVEVGGMHIQPGNQ